MGLLRVTLGIVFAIASAGCGDSTGLGKGSATGFWVAPDTPPKTGWFLVSDGSNVRGSGWFAFGESGALTGTQRADSIFLTFDAHGFAGNGVTVVGRVHADTIDGFFQNTVSAQFPVRLVRTANVPSGYATVAVRGGVALDYRELPGRFAGTTRGGFLLVFSTNRRSPNVRFALIGGPRPAPGQYTIGSPSDTYTVVASYDNNGVVGNLDSVRGTLRITRSTQFVITGQMEYECIDSKTGVRTTISAEFDVPCTEAQQCS